MSAGHVLVSVFTQHLAGASPPPDPGSVLPPIPTLPPGIRVPPERTGQIVAAAFAILLDLAGLLAVAVGSAFRRHRRP